MRDPFWIRDFITSPPPSYNQPSNGTISPAQNIYIITQANVIDAGMTTADVLRATTIVPAHFLKMDATLAALLKGR